MENIYNKLKGLWYDNPIRIYVHNRFVSRMHVLQSDLPKGRYFDLDRRILHTLFESFCYFVEHEQAITFKSTDDLAKYNWKNGRSRDAGLAHINWACSLVHDEDCCAHPGDADYRQSTSQALAAMEQKALYLWWRDERPARIDPYEAGLRGPAAIELETKQYEEDTEMLCRLMRIRGSLWT